MEWVQGETLFNGCGPAALEGNREAIAAVADRWLEAVQELSDNSVAHGDLQHANVMVTPPGELKLVDYDGMCVPPLVGRRNLEVGVEPYQHPDRGAGTLLSLDLDNFSALVIYVALRALAIQPGLWVKYVEQVGYDKLLFRREDFQAPHAVAAVLRPDATGQQRPAEPDRKAFRPVAGADGRRAAAGPVGQQLRRGRAAAGRPAVGSGRRAAQSPRPLPRRPGAAATADLPGLRARLPPAGLGQVPARIHGQKRRWRASRPIGSWSRPGTNRCSPIFPRPSSSGSGSSTPGNACSCWIGCGISSSVRPARSACRAKRAWR